MQTVPKQKSTRDRILEVTIELMWRQSYSTVSVDQICQVAKIQKGSFYHYFPSKVDVTVEAFEKLWQDKRSLFDKVFSPALPPMDRLSQYCDLAYELQKGLADKYGKVLGCPYMSCGNELSTQEEKVRIKIEEMFNRSAKYFESLLRDAAVEGLTATNDVVNASHEMLSYICGVMYQAKLKNDAEIIRRELKPGLLRHFNITAELPDKAVDRSVKSAAHYQPEHC
jgi:TetR/AcrR family transcriptional repressor of nem operon